MPAEAPKVSIIVPIHNVGSYLRETLDSTVNQTLKDIEIICVDDFSDDGCGEILSEYAQKDARIKLVSYTENKTASQARKDGVMLARGDYILFLDGDDSLEANACEELYAAIRKYCVDMLHFGTTVLNCDNLPAQRIERAENLLKPYPHDAEGSDLCRRCFIGREWGFSLWNKIYTRELCRKAFSAVEDGPFPKAQDAYAFFLLSYYARSYRGLEEGKYYRYGFGRGITGHEVMGIKQFERSCTQSLVSQAIRRFLEREGQMNAYRDIHASIHEGLICDCLNMWFKYLGSDLTGQGYDLLVRYWGVEDTVAFMAKLFWYRRDAVSDKLRGAQSLRRAGRQVKSIAVYYHDIHNGGVQRVITLLVPLWIKSGYRVVLCTDYEALPDDYPLPPSVERVVLPDFKTSTRAEYGKRAAAWARVISDYKVDAVVYNAWLSECLLWDLCVIKGGSASFIVHAHSVFSASIASLYPRLADISHIFPLADQLVVLSRTDEKFWKCINPHTKYIPNPITFSPEKIKPASLEGKDILWIGRISQEKNPIDAIDAFKIIVSEEPEARLLFVGGGKTPDAMNGIMAKIEEYGLGGSVILCGFQEAVGQYYAMASVLMFTSAYEGFPMTLAESKAYGVPIVLYDLPYIEMVRDSRGLVTVPQKDVKAMAAAVLGLLRDTARRREMGAQARESIRDFAAFDIAASWKNVFVSLENKDSADEWHNTEDTILVNTMVNHYTYGLQLQRKRFDTLNKKYDTLSTEYQKCREQLAKARKSEKKLAEIQKSEALKIGRGITYLPHLLKSKFAALFKR